MKFTEELPSFAVLVIALLLNFQACSADLLKSASVKIDDDESRKVFVISLDGFRADYLQAYRQILGNFSEITKHVEAEYVQPSFPSLTFPNHYSIATGVYPETHGIVHNSFVDVNTGQRFKRTSRDAIFWNSVEPIWVTAEKKNVTTAVHMWPGSVISFDGVRPTYFPNYYDETFSWASRIDYLLDVMTKGNKTAKLAMMYYHEPDKTSHYYGPNSTEIVKALTKLNDDIGYLLSQIRRRQLTEHLDLIICSDHGLTNINKDRKVVLSELFGNDHMDKFFDMEQELYSLQTIDPTLYGSVIHLWPRPDMIQATYEKLKDAHPHFRVYLKESIPKHWHYSHSPRIPPIVGVTTLGWQAALYRNVFDQSFLHQMHGMHGFDVLEPDMRAVFMATGPSFQSKVILPPFENVNIYSLIARLIGVHPQPNNGTFSFFLPALKEVWTLRELQNLKEEALQHNTAVAKTHSSGITLLFSFLFVMQLRF